MVSKYPPSTPRPYAMDLTTFGTPSPSSQGKTAFYAHSTPDTNEHNWQSLPEHLLNVGHGAGEFAAAFGAREMAEVKGYLHDLGKYTMPFQARLRGNPLRVDHSTWGARIAVQRFGPMGHLLAYGIAGHHAGLANGTGEGERTPLDERLKAQLPELDSTWEGDIPLPSKVAPRKVTGPISRKVSRATSATRFNWRF